MNLLFVFPQVALAEAVHSRHSGSQDKNSIEPKALVLSDEVQECMSAAQDGPGEKSKISHF